MRPVLVITTILALGASSCAQTSNGDREGDPAGVEVQVIDIHELDKMLNSGSEYVIVDVRTPKEIAEGKIDGALEIDFLAGGFEKAIEGFDRDKEYILYCRTGNRSGKAGNIMVNNGFKSVFNVVGGYQQWSREYPKN